MFDILKRRDFSKFSKYIRAILFLSMTFSIIGYAVDETIAQTKLIKVEKPLTPNELVGGISYFSDVDGTLNINQISKPDFQKNFKLAESEFINFGLITSPIWLKIRLENATKNEDRLLVYFRKSFFQQFSAFRTGANGEIISITEQDETTHFDARPVANPLLVVPVDIKPGQGTYVYIQYSSQNATTASISIETDRSLFDVTASTLAKNSIFNAMMALLFLIPAVIFVYSRNTVFFVYAASSLTCLLLFMELDGSGFQYLWPNHPQFNTQAAFVFGMISLFFFTMFVRKVLDTKKYHKISDKIFLLNMFIIATILLLTIFTDIPSLSISLILLFPITYVCCIITGLIAARKRFTEVRFFLMSWFMICVYSIRYMIQEVFLIDFSIQQEFDILRVVLTADAIFMGLGLVDRYNNIKSANNETAKVGQQTTIENLQLTKQINDLEKKFDTLCKIEETHDEKITKTIHDLGQQIPALRSKVQALLLSDDTQEQDLQSFEQNFNYLEGFISKTLESVSGKINDIKNAEDLAYSDMSPKIISEMQKAPLK